MNELEKKIEELRKQGYENIGISQVLQWISDIKRENRFKAYEYREKKKTNYMNT